MHIPEISQKILFPIFSMLHIKAQKQGSQYYYSSHVPILDITDLCSLQKNSIYIHITVKINIVKYIIRTNLQKQLSSIRANKQNIKKIS